MWHALPGPDPACLLSLTVLATLHCYASTRTAALLQMSFIDHERINVAKSNFPEGYICINNTYQAKKWIPNFLVQNNLTPPLRDHCAITLTGCFT